MPIPEVDAHMTRKGFLATAAGLAATLASVQGALGQTPSPSPSPTQPYPPRRTELGSARNIRQARIMLEKMIDQLQRDQHDFGGWRVKALEAIKQARYDLDQALQWDATHPH
jgi:hypothetical protein